MITIITIVILLSQIIRLLFNVIPNPTVSLSSAHTPIASVSVLPTATLVSSRPATQEAPSTATQIAPSLFQEASACLQVEPLSLTFRTIVGQKDPPPQTITISNCGSTGIVSTTVFSNNYTNWLTIASSETMTLANGDLGTVLATATNSKLPLGGGIYNSNIAIEISTTEGHVFTTAVPAFFILSS